MRTVKESRIIISNLSEAHAVALLPNIKEIAPGAKFELDHPDPPDLLEEAFDVVNDAVNALREVPDHFDDYYGEAENKRKVVAQIGMARREIVAVEKVLVRFRKAVDQLEAAAQKL